MTLSAQAMDAGGVATPGAGAQPCGCGDTIRALRTQNTALRHALVDSESEKAAALRREADTRAKMAKDRREFAARDEEAASTIATLRAWIEVHAGGGNLGHGDLDAAIAPSGACINDIMSTPLLAVQTALPRKEDAAAGEEDGERLHVEAVERPGPPRKEDAAAAAAAADVGAASGTATVAVQGGGGESELVRSLRNQLRMHENENTPPRIRSAKSKTRAMYRSVVKLALSDGAEMEAGAVGEGEEAAGAEGPLVVAPRKRGGQRGHKGASNNQKAQACFAMFLGECPDCHGTDFDKRRPCTKRMWDILGDWICGLVPRDERARAMIELAVRLAADGAQGACVCISIMFQRRYCRTCDKVVKASVTFLIGGSAIGEICHSMALMFSEYVPDTCVASWLRDMSGFPLLYDAVRTGRLRRSIPLGPINDKIEDHIASAPSHAKDESPGKGHLAADGSDAAAAAAAAAAASAAAEGLPVPLEDAAEAAVAAVGATSNRTIQYLVAAVPDAVMIRVSPNRSGKSMAERFQRLDGRPYASDEYTVYANDKETEVRQTDHPHLLRKTEHYAAEALAVLHAEGRIGYEAVILHRRKSSEWARKSVGDIMEADPSATRFDGSGPAAGADATTSGDDALSPSGSCRPLPPIPPMPYLPLSASQSEASGGGGGGPDPMTDEEASARRNEIGGDALFSGICHWIKFWDTASPETEMRLQALVRLVIERHYAEGHPARKAVENAADALFKALRIKGMKFDTTDVERAVRDVVQPERRAHKHIRCQEAADASSKAPSFTGSCRRNGISPMLAFRKILRDPEWSMFEEDRPPPQPPPQPAAAHSS